MLTPLGCNKFLAEYTLGEKMDWTLLIRAANEVDGASTKKTENVHSIYYSISGGIFTV